MAKAASTRSADRDGQVDGAQRFVQGCVGFVEILVPQALSFEGQSLTEPQESPLGRAGSLIP